MSNIVFCPASRRRLLSSRKKLAIALAAQLALLCPSVGNTQPVRERPQTDATASSTMCGITGTNALDLIRVIKLQTSLVEVKTNSSRFEAYSSTDTMSYSWVFTKPTEFAYPAVTCRHVYQDTLGNWIQTREMRCDANRKACNALSVEFGQLDEQARQSVDARIKR